MKKKLVCLVVICAMVIAAVGCGKSSDKKTATSTVAEDASGAVTASIEEAEAKAQGDVSQLNVVEDKAISAGYVNDYCTGDAYWVPMVIHNDWATNVTSVWISGTGDDTWYKIQDSVPANSSVSSNMLIYDSYLYYDFYITYANGVEETYEGCYLADCSTSGFDLWITQDANNQDALIWR